MCKILGSALFVFLNTAHLNEVWSAYSGGKMLVFEFKEKSKVDLILFKKLSNFCVT